MTKQPLDEEQLIEQQVLRMSSRATGLGLGVLLGVAMFLATLVLALRGGPWTGEHLGLLGQFYPGYSVSVGGAFLGLLYGFVTGAVGGYLLAAVYNRFAD
jgi:hypothetical protein